jgi:hypothetical protein
VIVPIVWAPILSAAWKAAVFAGSNAVTWVTARAKSGREARDARQDAARAITTAAGRVRVGLRGASDRIQRAARTGNIGVLDYFNDPERPVAEPAIVALREAFAGCTKFPQSTHTLWEAACSAVEAAARSDGRLRDLSAVSAPGAIQVSSYQNDIDRACDAIDLAFEETIVIAARDTAATIRHLLGGP